MDGRGSTANRVAGCRTILPRSTEQGSECLAVVSPFLPHITMLEPPSPFHRASALSANREETFTGLERNFLLGALFCQHTLAPQVPTI